MATLIQFLLLFKLYLVIGAQINGSIYITHTSSNIPEFSSILYNFYQASDKELTYSEFESFYNCSLGISQCYRNVSIISERTQIECNSGNASNPACKLLHECVSAKDVLSFIGKNETLQDTISKEEFQILIPVVTYQSQGQFCDQYHDSHSTIHKLPSSAEVWGYGILFVTIISSCSLAGVSVLPLMAKGCYQKLLTLLVGLAAGSLVSSAVFHLIPQAFKITTNVKGDHGYLFVSLSVLAGIWAFFMIERFISIVLHGQKNKKQTIYECSSMQGIVGDCKYSSSITPSYNNESFKCDINKEMNASKVEDVQSEVSDTGASCGVRDLQLIIDSQSQAINASFGHEKKAEKVHNEVHFKQGEDSVIATVAWMIIFGDGFHNFIDGVSIGAAFQQSILTGISISLAVICEELPHELGDFAVLLNSGMTMKQALFYNFLSATTCYLGMCVGILLGEFTQDSTYIFALAGGMFLYIALVDMLPEMRDTAEKSMKNGAKELMMVLILQNIGMVIGVLLLFFLAYYQDYLMLE